MEIKIINLKSTYSSDPRNFDKFGQAYDPYKMCGLGMTNYVLSFFSVAAHFIVLGYFMDFWCGQSKLAIFYTFQFTVMHAYLWALPDRRYSEWVKDKQTWFIVFAIINLSLYLIGIVVGLVMYFASKDGMIQFTGIGLIAFQLFANTFMVICVILAFINLKGRFKYEEQMFYDNLDAPIAVIDEPETTEVAKQEPVDSNTTEDTQEIEEDPIKEPIPNELVIPLPENELEIGKLIAKLK